MPTGFKALSEIESVSPKTCMTNVDQVTNMRLWQTGKSPMSNLLAQETESLKYGNC